MSTLIDNLQSIYTTKLQIKEVIGTQSDVFETYPELIAAAIGTGGGIDWDEVAAYGYIVPAGTVTLSSNGTVDVSTYANAYVNVPQSGGEGLDWDDVAQAGYIVPAGTYSITSNGTFDVTTYASAVVNVPTGGGSGYYYPVHTISEINEFTIIDGSAPYMWMIDADEYDGETESVITGVFTNKYWGYCYPQEIEAMENPVLDIDGLWGLNMVSYTDLVKREFTYNALPDFNTYKGYTYSYQYVNPEYDPELGNDEYLTYEFNYGDDLLYSTQLEIVNLSQRERLAANECFSGVYRVYDSDQVGLNGYYDETEMGEGNYVNKQWLSIGVLQPSESSNTVTQFTSSYHAAASYTTGFDPYSLIGYNWNAVVDGCGWLVDIVSKGSVILVDSMWALDVNYENPTYFTSSGNNFIRTMSFSDEHIDDYGNEYLKMEMNGKEYDFNIGFGYIWDLFGVNPSDEDIPASGSNTFDVIFSNGEPSHIEAGEINNFYHDWNLSVTLSIPNNWYANSEGTGTMTVTWTFSGTPNE